MHSSSDFNLISNHDKFSGTLSQSNGGRSSVSRSPSRKEQQLGQLVASALPDPLMLTEYDLKRKIPLRHRNRKMASGSEGGTLNGSKSSKEEALTNSGPSTPSAMTRRYAAKALQDDRKKFQVASWKLLYTSFVSALGLMVILQEPWAFDSSQYFLGWPDEMPRMR